MITFGSLFAGIGGFDLGFERAGMVCKWQVEIDDYATRVLEKHWPGVHRERDIRLDGERSGLFYEAIRVVRELQPKVVVLENVAALLTRGLGTVLGELASIGFDAEWHCIPAAYVGAPHIRDRIFILGHTEMQQWESKPSGKGFTPNSNCEGLEKWQGKDSDGARAICGTEFGRSQWWESEPNVGRVAYGVSRRVDRLRGLGNAIVPQVAEWIGRQIVGALQ